MRAPGDPSRPTTHDVHGRWLEHRLRAGAIGGLSIAEDIAYGLLGALLLAAAVWQGVRTVIALGSPGGNVAGLLDHLLLVLVFLELLHTMLLYLRTHRFRHEPFLIVGIIAAIRRILVITAAQPTTANGRPGYLIELGVLTAMILAMAVALRLSSRSTGRGL